MLPETLSHYRILERLGAGGMGEVFLAEDTELRRRVAVKLLPGDSQDDQQLRQLRHEARLLARLNHPNIVTIHSVERADEQNFLTIFSNLARRGLVEPILVILFIVYPVLNHRIHFHLYLELKVGARGQKGGWLHLPEKMGDHLTPNKSQCLLIVRLEYAIVY